VAVWLVADLAMGFPFEHGLHSTLIAVRLGDRLGVDATTARDTYYACLLMHAGCTTDAETAAEIFGGSLTTHVVPVMFGSDREMFAGLLHALPTPGRPGPVRAMEIARRLPRAGRERTPHLKAMCEVAQMLAERLGLPPPVSGLFAHLTERWDGRGPLRRSGGAEVPLPLRIVHVARDASLQQLLGGVDRSVDTVRKRAGGAFDPNVAGCFVAHAEEILSLDDEPSAWDETLAAEPPPRLTLDGAAIDRALGAIGDFTDLVSPYLAGHSAGVTELATAAAGRCGCDASTCAAVRRGALVHDVGRVAVHPRIWQKPGKLTADEWEQVRLHPYHTGRVLSRSPFLTALAPIAGAHHERLDGSGYHRGASGVELSLPARLVAAADTYHAMIEPRSHRRPLGAEEAAENLVREAREGRLDSDAVTAVVEAAGQPPPRIERPRGLTDREAQVLRLLARGLQTKQVARALAISAKTADHHVQNVYRKIGVSSRAAAALFAMEHGLVGWGELPMAAPPASP